ncbi:Protein kinase domain and Serine/threonine-/dual specificity protein kinase, catalytic domain and Protein kinase-like domain-containing protein [Strongyloides ratti]|uniref:non-specific serine/threonine protein kinase n=1 Tax=Strongyloides ratti TaxID=34506 RepID=A0A090LKM5_STRRB|nr:Protein kinase domain and Serine/threonine-/dual specificity protein kinase, catalytic domain and Protein kinase-like domain-containing protein [Strongyloides ratti]CEF70384.1 Protein kinase domain and Serine/threonine-/dual specificity protein kinase, catalytic domain and Protein kinase-like domain-containing protein [Strongyloides ratti]
MSLNCLKDLKTKESFDDSTTLAYDKLSGFIVSDWKIFEIIGKGGFGCVYRCSSMKDRSQAAFKAEKDNEINTADVLFECKILQLLEKEGISEHFTHVFDFGQCLNFQFMVVTLLGPNLYEICSYLPEEKYELSTWVRVMYQILESIQYLHKVGYIHNDLKPGNFVIGNKYDIKRRNVIHLVDFGLASKYGDEKNPVNLKYKTEKKGIEYIGTITHCSPNAHLRTELGRRDDIWGWLFLSMDFYNEMPWTNLVTEEEIEACKLSLKIENYCQYLPHEYNIILENLKILGVYDEPKYSLYYNQLELIIKKYNISWDDPYQWELLPFEAKEVLNLSVSKELSLDMTQENDT